MAQDFFGGEFCGFWLTWGGIGGNIVIDSIEMS